MLNPFKKIAIDGKTQKEKELQKKISQKSWDITKKFPIGKCKPSDINELEELYNKYHKEFPNVEKEISHNKMITKLRFLIE